MSKEDLDKKQQDEQEKKLWLVEDPQIPTDDPNVLDELVEIDDNVDDDLDDDELIAEDLTEGPEDDED